MLKFKRRATKCHFDVARRRGFATHFRFDTYMGPFITKMYQLFYSVTCALHQMS